MIYFPLSIRAQTTLPRHRVTKLVMHLKNPFISRRYCNKKTKKKKESLLRVRQRGLLRLVSPRHFELCDEDYRVNKTTQKRCRFINSSFSNYHTGG